MMIQSYCRCGLILRCCHGFFCFLNNPYNLPAFILSSQSVRTIRGKLYQVRIRPAMVDGSGVGHTTSTDQDFVYYHVAPWVFGSIWPPTESAAYLGN